MKPIAAAVLALVIPTVLNAQTIDACYVKNTGTMYRVGAPSSPSKCSNNHIGFSWNQQGPMGPAGPQGLQGPQGPAGASGALGYQFKESIASGIWLGVVSTRSLYCGAGEVILGGGFHTQGQHDDLQVIFSGPVLNSSNYYGWEVRARNTSNTTPLVLVLHVMCAKAPTA